MRKFGLIGYPLSHSFSKNYFAEKFDKEKIEDATYELYPLSSIEDYPNLISRVGQELKGLNVTIPYKQAIIPYLDALDSAASTIGAINTILFERGGTIGYNTDAQGFESSLLKVLISPYPQALVLGNGGAAKAVQYVLKKLDIAFQMVSRIKTPNSVSYEDLTEEMVRSSQLIINTTPLGMYPHLDACPPLNYGLLGTHHILYDLIYNPQKTVFLTKGEAQGCKILNGLDMLYGQAEASWKIWNT